MKKRNIGTYVTEFRVAMSVSTDPVETAIGNNLLIKAYRKGVGERTDGRIMQTKLLKHHSVCVGHETDLPK